MCILMDQLLEKSKSYSQSSSYSRSLKSPSPSQLCSNSQTCLNFDLNFTWSTKLSAGKITDITLTSSNARRFAPSLCSFSISPAHLDSGQDDFFDPLRQTDGMMAVSEDITSVKTTPADTSDLVTVRKDWSSFKKILMQRVPVSKTTPISMVSGVLVKGNKVFEKSRDLQSGELDDDKIFDEEDLKTMSQQECLLKLQELKAEINKSWCADDRVTALRLSIKVARLLMDTSIIQFYPTLFVLATDIMDMLGDLVLNRIKQKAEVSEDRLFISLVPADICVDAKETCTNWFSKVGSVRELLPRIYLELALLPCWLFLHNQTENILERLVMMMRGIADPLASSYCRLYLVQCAQRLPQHGIGFLITCINDLKVLLVRLISASKAGDANLSGSSKLLLTLIEPTIECIVKCLFKDLKQEEISNVLDALGMGMGPSTLSEKFSCISIILHYILKELPIGFTCFNSVEIQNLIECADDSSFDQCLNFKLLGHRLCERVPEVSRVHLVVDKIIQVLSGYDTLHPYLMVADSYLDIILENQLCTSLNLIMEGIFERAQEGNIGENELVILQSILLKLLGHFANIENILALNHFVDILDMMHGSTRNSVNMHILSMATRNGQIRDPMVIEVLFEVAQSLYDGLDFLNMRKEDYQHPARVISRFVYMVDYGMEVESHLRFFAQCRGAFAFISEIQEMLVHSSNNLAVRAMRDTRSSSCFVKSCFTFNEVTIPALPTNLKQLNLYLETAEVALLGGFISHSDGLIDAALNCLQKLHSIEDGPTAEDVDWVISQICKLCGMLVMVPGSLEQGVASIPKHVLSFLDSHPWVSSRMKTKVLSAVILLSAALSQSQLLYHGVSGKVMCNCLLFYGVPSYYQELLSLSGIVLQGIVDVVMKESSAAVRGKLALQACNCVASSFKISDETLEACSKLLEIAESCLGAGDKFLQSTLKFLDSRQFLVEGPEGIVHS